MLTIEALLGMAAHLDGNAFMTLDFSGLAQKGGAVLSHVRLASSPEQVTSPRIVAGRADLLLAADAVVTVAPSVLGLCSQTTHALVSRHLIAVSNFVMHPDYDFKQDQCLNLIAKHVHKDIHQLDFHKLALQQMGDTIFANVMLLGFAVQKGLGIEAPQMLNIQPTVATYKELLLDRQQRLVAYQNLALADQLTAQLDYWQQKFTGLLPVNQSLPLMRALATSYFKLMAVKDEYEVARLFTQADFKALLAAEFTGDYKISLNLSPLGFAGWNKHLKQPKKYTIGSWILTLMKPLAMLKVVRGSKLDPYSYHPERPAEKAFLSYFVASIDDLIGLLNKHNQDRVLATINVFEQVRGYGQVRAASMAQVRIGITASLQDMSLDEQAYAA